MLNFKKILYIFLIFNISLIYSISIDDFDFFTNMKFEGFLQLRYNHHITDLAIPTRLVSVQHPNLNKASIQGRNSVYLNRIEYTVISPVNNYIRIKIKGALSGARYKFKELYVTGNLIDRFEWKLGKLQIPFGYNFQESYSQDPRTESSALYSMKNFGYSGQLGLNIFSSSSSGLQLKYEYRTTNKIFNFLLRGGIYSNTLMLGNKHDSNYSTVWNSKIYILPYNKYFNLSFGGSYHYANAEMLYYGYKYIPIGIPGDLKTNPDGALSTVHRSEYMITHTIGYDIQTKLFSCIEYRFEYIDNNTGDNNHNGQSHNIYITHDIMDYHTTLFGRYETIGTNFNDGTIKPNSLYKIISFGLSTKWNRYTITCEYLKTVLDDSNIDFYGSDIVITQVQYSF